MRKIPDQFFLSRSNSASFSPSVMTPLMLKCRKYDLPKTAGKNSQFILKLIIWKLSYIVTTKEIIKWPCEQFTSTFH